MMLSWAANCYPGHEVEIMARLTVGDAAGSQGIG